MPDRTVCGVTTIEETAGYREYPGAPGVVWEDGGRKAPPTRFRTVRPKAAMRDALEWVSAKNLSAVREATPWVRTHVGRVYHAKYRA